MESPVAKEETVLSGSPDTVRQLANRIWLRHTEGAPGELVRLPGERQLSRSFKATRYAVDNALNFLEQDGRLVRMARSGSFVRRIAERSDSSPSDLRCINFIHPPSMLGEPMQWIVQDLLAGYTEGLEHHHVKSRFAVCPGMLSCWTGEGRISGGSILSSIHCGISAQSISLGPEPSTHS